MLDGVAITIYGEPGGPNHGGTTAGLVDMLVGAAEIKVDAREAEIGEAGGSHGEVVGIFAPDLSDNRRICGCDFETFKGVLATFVGSVAANIGKLGEKEVWTASVSDNLSEDNISDALHGGEN